MCLLPVGTLAHVSGLSECFHETQQAEDADGKTPLQTAVQRNRHQVLELMSGLANFGRLLRPIENMTRDNNGRWCSG